MMTFDIWMLRALSVALLLSVVGSFTVG